MVRILWEAYAWPGTPCLFRISERRERRSEKTLPRVSSTTEKGKIEQQPLKIKQARNLCLHVRTCPRFRWKPLQELCALDACMAIHECKYVAASRIA